MCSQQTLPQADDPTRKVLHGKSFEHYRRKRRVPSVCAIFFRGMDVRITRLDESVSLPSYQTAGAAGFDLASSVEMTIAPGEVALVPTGLVIAAPPGHFVGVFARSSTPLKRGLMVANGVGIVDADYSGPQDEIRIEVLNFTSAPVVVRRGDRLAQGVILPFVRASWKEGPADGRTRGGFGATG
jgi:dUTP pyrophosphatase